MWSRSICKRRRNITSRKAVYLHILIRDSGRRAAKIDEAHVALRYKLKEIADYLVIHYTTVSKKVKGVEGRN
jgi:hypothetical protein